MVKDIFDFVPCYPEVCMFPQKQENHEKKRSWVAILLSLKGFLSPAPSLHVSIHLSSRQPRSLRLFPASTSSNGGFLLFPGAGAAG